MMAKTTKPRSGSRQDQSFHEYMPGATMSTYDIFPVSRDAYFEDEQVEMQEATDSDVKRRMMRQLLLLVGLLAIQFILFVVLIRSTLSLA